MSIVTYAQNFEDVRLWRAFRDVVAGRYIDIGTQDPVHDSVSLAFYERNWRGIHVEPTPTYAAAMRAARPDETVIEAAVSTSPGPIRFFEIPSTGLSTGTRDIAERHISDGWPCHEIVVPTVTLSGLFDLMGPDLVHWLKIDVEGMEADVLESWGDHPARPAALVIEATAPGTQYPTHEAWHAMVTQRGYVDVLFDGLSRYFVHETHAHRGAALALSPNVFDGYQIHKGHFAASYLREKGESDIVTVREEIEAEQVRQAAAMSQQLRAAQALHEVDIANAAENATAARAEAERLRNELLQHEEAHSISLAEAQAAVTRATEQLEATLQDVADLQQQLAEKSQAHSAERAQAESAAAEASARLEKAKAALIDLELRKAREAREHEIALESAYEQLGAIRQQHLEASFENDRAQAELALRLAELERQINDETQAHALTRARAEAEAASAAAKLEAKRSKLVELATQNAELSRKHAMVLETTQERAHAAERTLAEVANRLDILQQEHIVLARENGRLEGQLGAQVEAYSARLADSAATHRTLEGRLSWAELALDTAKADLEELRGDLISKAQQHQDSLNAAEQAYALKAEALAASNAECNRLEHVIAAIEERLNKQIAVSDVLIVHRNHLEAHRDALMVELHEMRETAAAEVLALNDGLARLENHVECRERQLQAATALLDGMPQPLAGLPRFITALVRPWRSAAELAIIANHREALNNFHSDLLLSPLLEVPHGAQMSSANRNCPALAAVEHRGFQNMERDEPITSVTQLLAPHDREFISTAYEAVLGRSPDPKGEAYYLARLRAGAHKLAILKQLRRSPEGRNFIPGVAGLDRAIKRHIWTTLPILGALLLRLLGGGEDNSATHRQLRIIANDVGRLELGQSRLRAQHSALVAAIQELARDGATRQESPGANSTLGTQPEATSLCESGMQGQGLEPPLPYLGGHGSRMYRLLTTSLQLHHTQGAN